MSYTPSFEDIPQATAQSSYTPSFEDIPQPQVNKQRNLFNIDESRMHQFHQTLKEAGTEGLPGAAQGFGNSMIGLANLPGKAFNYMAGTKGIGEIPKFNFAPNTEAAHEGEMLGDIASYFGPRAGIKAITGAKNLGKLENYLESRPIRNFLLKNLGMGAEAGAYAASHAPEGKALPEGLKGLGLGSATHGLSSLLGIPYLGNFAGGGLGYLAGQQVGHPYIGAELGFGAPSLAKRFLPASETATAEEMLGGLQPKDVARVSAAAERQGLRVKPSEASGNPIQAGIEAQPRKTIAGAQEHVRQEMGREYEQQNSIKNLLNKIYTPTPQNEAKINALYQKAYHPGHDLNMSTVNALKQDPIMMDAFNSVKRNSAFTDVPENNYAFLHQVDRTLGRQYRGKLKTDTNTAYEIDQTRKNFTNLLKKDNPDYAAAQKEAQPKLQRQNIEEKINEDVENEKVTGKDFYNKVLKNYKNYKELIGSLKNNPEAKQAIKDMRVIFKNSSKLPSVSVTAEQQAKGWVSPRDWFSTLTGKMKDLVGSQTDVAKIKYINSGQWMKDFDKLQDIKDARKYNKELIELVKRMGIAYGLTPNASENFAKAISE